MVISNSTIYSKVSYGATTANNAASPPSKPKEEQSSVSVPVYNPAKTAFGRLASYKDLLSKSAPIMSDDEFIEKTKQQAQKDFSNGVFQGSEFGSLCRAYVSVVSPDRAGMIERAIKSGNSSIQKPALHLWEILMQLEKGEKIPLNVSHYNLNPDGSIHNMTICDSNGTPIIGYTQDGWMDFFTPEETARSQSLYQIYNEAWRAAKAEAEASAFEQVPGDLGIGKFDASA